MANFTVAFAKHATLSGGSVDTVTLTNTGQLIEVINRDTSTNVIYIAVGTTDAAVPNPSVAGDDNPAVPPGGTRVITVPAGNTGNDMVVKLISSGNAAYSVQVGGQ